MLAEVRCTLGSYGRRVPRWRFALKSRREGRKEGTAVAVQGTGFGVLSTGLRGMLGNVRLDLAGGDLEALLWLLAQCLGVK